MSTSFDQDPLYGNQTIILEERQLIVRTVVLGIKDERAFWLRDIDPAIQTVRTGLRRLLFSTAFTATLFIGFFRLLPPKFFSDSILDDVFIAIVVLVSCWAQLKPIKGFQIRAKNGSLIVQLYATKAKRFKCEDFIQAVNDRMLKR